MKGSNQIQVCKIFVGGLPTDASKRELEEFLLGFIPKVEITIKPRHNNPDLNLGFAILAVDSKRSYQYLLDMNRTQFKGKLIEFKPFLEGKKLEKMLEGQDQRRLMLVGLPSSIGERELVPFLEKFGTIDNFYFVKDFKSKMKTGNAVIIYRKSQSSTKLQKSSPFLIQGSVIHVRRIENNQAKSKKGTKGDLLPQAPSPESKEERHGRKPRTKGKRRRKRAKGQPGERRSPSYGETGSGYMRKAEVAGDGNVDSISNGKVYDILEDVHTKIITRRGRYANSFYLQCILEELKKGAWQSSHRVYNIRLNRRKKRGGKNRARLVRRTANRYMKRTIKTHSPFDDHSDQPGSLLDAWTESHGRDSSSPVHTRARDLF